MHEVTRDRCDLHLKTSFTTESDAKAVADRLNARLGTSQVKTFCSERCGAWHVTRRGGEGARARRSQRRAAGNA